MPTDFQAYKFNDGIFTFWTAEYGSWAGDRKVVFRVRQDTTAAERAKEKDIVHYDRLRLATPTEILSWFHSHASFLMKLAQTS